MSRSLFVDIAPCSRCGSTDGWGRTDLCSRCFTYEGDRRPPPRDPRVSLWMGLDWFEGRCETHGWVAFDVETLRCRICAPRLDATVKVG